MAALLRRSHASSVLCQRPRAFSTSVARTASLQWDKNDSEALKDAVPGYPYGPAQWYKQSAKGLYGGARVRFGNNVTGKFNTRTRRRWDPNLVNKRLWSRALNRFVQIRVTTRVLRTIDKLGGLDEYLLGEKEARIRELGESGWWLRWAIMQTPAIKKRFREERKALGLPEEPEAVEAADENGEASAPDGPLDTEAVVLDDAFQIEHNPQLPPLKFRVEPGKHIMLTANGWVRTKSSRDRWDNLHKDKIRHGALKDWKEVRIKDARDCLEQQQERAKIKRRWDRLTRDIEALECKSAKLLDVDLRPAFRDELAEYAKIKPGRWYTVKVGWLEGDVYANLPKIRANKDGADRRPLDGDTEVKIPRRAHKFAVKFRSLGWGIFILREKIARRHVRLSELARMASDLAGQGAAGADANQAAAAAAVDAMRTETEQKIAELARKCAQHHARRRLFENELRGFEFTPPAPAVPVDGALDPDAAPRHHIESHLLPHIARHEAEAGRLRAEMLRLSQPCGAPAPHDRLLTAPERTAVLAAVRKSINAEFNAKVDRLFALEKAQRAAGLLARRQHRRDRKASAAAGSVEPEAE